MMKISIFSIALIFSLSGICRAQKAAGWGVPVEVAAMQGANSSALDFSAVPFGKGVIFTSNRNADKGNQFDKTENIWCFDLWFAERKGFGQYESARPLAGEVNGKMHDGTACIVPGGTKMIFARNNPKTCKSTGRRTLDLCESWLTEGLWQKPLELPLNASGSTSCHPALSPDNKWLVFASDRPGTLGGMDLWASMRDGLSWSAPVNLGPEINTAGNEIFPFIAPDGSLYFSSSGHGGAGKIDIFHTKSKGSGDWSDWMPIENMGEPFNTMYDDFAFVLQSDGRSGYFSSNRADGRNDDLYEWRAPEPKPETPAVIETPPPPKPTKIPGLVGSVREIPGAKPVAGTKIVLLNKKTGETLQLNTDASGNFRFPDLPCDADFELVAGAERANPVKRDISTKGACEVSEPAEQRVLIELPAPPPPAALTDLGVSEVKAGTVIRLNKLYYDLGKHAIRPDAAIELDKVVALMKQYPMMTIELSSHTDSRGSKESNQALSQRRATAARDYIVSKGIGNERVTGVGFGESKLVNQCADGAKCSEEQHQENRRTEVRVVKMDEGVEVKQ